MTHPLWWAVDRLVGAYGRRELSPVEVAELATARIEATHASLLPECIAFYS